MLAFLDRRIRADPSVQERSGMGQRVQGPLAPLGETVTSNPGRARN